MACLYPGAFRPLRSSRTCVHHNVCSSSCCVSEFMRIGSSGTNVQGFVSSSQAKTYSDTLSALDYRGLSDTLGPPLPKSTTTNLSLHFVNIRFFETTRTNTIDILALGCQRVIFDTNYLKALHQPNLQINYDGITAISNTGILTQRGEHQVHPRNSVRDI